MSDSSNIVGIILGAGRSRRMGLENKLVAEINGKPMIVHAIEAVKNSRVNKTILVTGHQREIVEKAVQGIEIEIIYNPNFKEGLSSSIKSIGHELSKDVDAGIVCLGDMPSITSTHINSLIKAFKNNPNRQIVVPIYDGRRGTPVLWGKKHFSLLVNLTGDQGAKALFQKNENNITEVQIEDNAIHTDLDTPEALERYRSNFR